MLENKSAVDPEHRSVDVTGFIRRQKQVRVSDLRRGSHPAERRFLDNSSKSILPHGTRHFGVDETRSDGVHGDALRAEFSRPDLSHTDDAGLGRDVIRLAEVALVCHDRGGADDAS